MARSGQSVREISARVVEHVLKNGAFADQLLEKRLAEKSLAVRDRALLVEIVNGTLRWHGQLDWILRQYFKGDYAACSRKLKSILEITLYQLRFLDKIPAYAAVSEGVSIAKRLGGPTWGRLTNGILRNYIRHGQELRFPRTQDDPVAALATQFSHPDWIIARWLKRYGLEATKLLCDWNNRRPEISLRVNLSKTTTAGALNYLLNAGINAHLSPVFQDYIRISKSSSPTQLPGFDDGHFIIQDESAAIPALLLDPQKGERILDLCAAPGGKTCHMAHLMGDRGQIIAMDRNFTRMRRLTENMGRLDLKSITPVIADGTVQRVRSIDKVLLDAPCSGLGVLAKRADLRWKRTPSDISKLKLLQERLLRNAAVLVPVRGVIVYSTCTLEPEETDEVVEDFLREHSDFRVEDAPNDDIAKFKTSEGYYMSVPHTHKMDGVFGVKLVKVR